VEFGNFGSTSQYNCLETTFSPLPSSSSFTGYVRLIQRRLLGGYGDGLSVFAEWWFEVVRYLVKDEFVYRMG
jgi:hypothetical protein